MARNTGTTTPALHTKRQVAMKSESFKAMYTYRKCLPRRNGCLAWWQIGLLKFYVPSWIHETGRLGLLDDTAPGRTVDLSGFENSSLKGWQAKLDGSGTAHSLRC